MSARKSLQTLQRSSQNSEKLVGRANKSLKPQILTDILPKQVLHKETQTNSENQISKEDLTTLGEPSETYWKRLAEKKGEALEEALNENAELHATIKELRDQLEKHKKMLDEANCFIEVVKEELEKQENDTGIDVNDISYTEDPTSDNTEPAITNGTA